MTWDWIADTLQMIENDLRGRQKLVDRHVAHDVERAYQSTRQARDRIVSAIEKMQRPQPVTSAVRRQQTSTEEAF